MNKFFIFICTFTFQIAGTKGYTQGMETDSVRFKLAIENVVSRYRLFEGDQSRLYNGTMYRDYSVTLTEGHPYFETNEFSKGIIYYDGMVYDVPILYNLVTGEVVIPHYNKVYKMSLINDKITEFMLLGHHFIRLVEGSSSDLLRTGFYDQLYAGKLTVLKKTSKFIEEIIANDKLIRLIHVTHGRYLQKDGAWYKVSSLRSVLSILKDKKDNIRRYLNKNKIRFRKKPDEALVKIAAYYDTLTR